MVLYEEFLFWDSINDEDALPSIESAYLDKINTISRAGVYFKCAKYLRWYQTTSAVFIFCQNYVW